MPISPERQKLYPSNWAAISLLTRQRAGWKCELCGVGQRQFHLVTGGYVILTVHHINGDPRDNRRLNLIALCQRCDNVGLYLAEDGQARFCQCEKGRLKRASWNIDAGVRKRDEKIQKALEKMPPSLGPVRGLHEWNPLGFWEDTEEEHDHWMARKRAELVEIHARADIRDRRLAAEKKTWPREIMKRLVMETIGQMQAARPEAEREPGADEEEEEVPF
jgi:hypothetical protein